MSDRTISHLSICTLQAGRSPEGALREAHGDYDEMCKALLGRAPDQSDTFAVLDGEFPESLEPYDVILVTGSRHGVYEDHPWIPPLEDLLRGAYAGGKRIIGICFGHQILAQALGGKVEKSDKGFGIGVMDYEFVDEAGGSQTLSLCAWHQDQIMTPPAGAEIIARSDFCPVAGLRYGDRAISFQAHPEFAPAYMRDLITSRRGGMISESAADEALAGLERPVHKSEIQALLGDFLASKERV